MSKHNISQEEEIELGSLFKIIGRGFSNLFNAVGKLFKGIFHYFILFLIFLRNNALKLSLAILVGAAIGLYLDLTKPELYSSTMIVEPNFKSTQQLYNNVNFYNELVKQKDSILLGKIFQIPISESSKLKGFYIEPIRNENEKYEFFDNFIEEVDTTTVKNISIKEFIKAFTDYNYKYHKIKVRSANSRVFEQLNDPIINSVSNNPYFKNQKRINEINLLQNESVLVKSLKEVDTLRRIYNEVLLTEANKIETGTNISLAQGIKKTDELKLFDESLKLNMELVENNKEKAETTEILNVVSAFSKVGIKERSLTKKMTFIFGFGMGLLMLIFILLGQLNQFLLKY